MKGGGSSEVVLYGNGLTDVMSKLEEIEFSSSKSLFSLCLFKRNIPPVSGNDTRGKEMLFSRIIQDAGLYDISQADDSFVCA